MRAWVLAIGWTSWLWGQGLPFWRTYSEDDYGAYTQVRAIAQDRETGLIYVGTNQGISEYDGQRWRLYPTASLVRSLAVSPNHRIWVGARNDFGELRTDSIGRLAYLSYTSFLPRDQQRFGEIEAIYTDDQNQVYFVGTRGVIYLDGSSLAVAPRAFLVGGQVFISGSGRVGSAVWVNLRGGGGLHQITSSGFEPLPGGKLFDDKFVSAILQIRQSVYVLTEEGAIFESKGRGNFSPLKPQAEAYLRQNRIYRAAVLDDHLLIGTLNGGVLLVAPDGRTVSEWTRKQGFPDEDIYAVFVDAFGNAWISHGRGLTHVLYALPLRTYGPLMNIEGRITSILPQGAQAYVTTIQGIFRVSLTQRTVQRVEGLQGECWEVAALKGRILVASSRGLYEVTGTTATPIITGKAFVGIAPSAANDAQAYVYGRSGLYRLQYEGGRWKEQATLYSADVQSLIDQGDALWIGTSTGVYRLNPSSGAIEADEEALGLEKANYYIGLVDGLLLAQSGQRIFVYREAAKQFEPSAELGSVLGEDRVDQLPKIGDTPLLRLREGVRILSHSPNGYQAAALLEGKPFALNAIGVGQM